jgi:hypothetical protein
MRGKLLQVTNFVKLYGCLANLHAAADHVPGDSTIKPAHLRVLTQRSMHVPDSVHTQTAGTNATHIA